jgi:uncharacterized phiE125 gp8 family phage protein
MIIRDYDMKAGRQWRATTPPASEPLTVQQVKDFGRIDGSDEDILIGGFITAVREATEGYLGRALIERTMRMTFDYWPDCEYLELPTPPLLSVVQVATVDNDNVATEFSSANYIVDTSSMPGRIIIKFGCVPPINTSRFIGGYRVDYTAGYGSTASYIPAPIIEGMKLWAVACYENRTLPGTPPIEAKTFMSQYRMVQL